MQDVIERFYEAFSRRDATSMNACYHPDVTFSDPVFTELRGDRARAMWEMLCERGKDLRVEASDIAVEGEQGRAHWEAWYTFSATGRKVHNVIDATFAFKDGLIYQHTDAFDLKRWARQALGPLAGFMAGSPFIQKKIQGTAVQSLEQYLARGR
jgi:ketosteroid isomerase-like protein